MKNLTFVITNFSSGGAERVLSIIANHFAQNQNYKVTVVMLEKYRVDYFIHPAIDVVVIKKPPKFKSARILYRLFKLRKTFKKSDIIISFLWHINLYTVIAAFCLKKKVIISDRSDPRNELENTSKAIKAIRRHIYGLANCIVFQMPDAKEYYPLNVQQKSYIIPNPINPLLPEPNNGKREKTILVVGRLAPQKNIGMAISSFYKFHKFHPEYKLKIFGEGAQLEELKGMVSKMEINSSVSFEGFTNNIYNEMYKAGMYISSSNYEGISNSMLEALGMGMPVIATDCPVGGARQYIKNGENGILIPVGDVNALFKAMRIIAEDHEFAMRISTSATKIRQMLNESSICKMWEDIL